jgi:carbon monoxide dehydrogenase subunit G
VFASIIPKLKGKNKMLLKGDVTIHAPREKVWDFLTDQNQVGQCVLGVEKIEMDLHPTN